MTHDDDSGEELLAGVDLKKWQPPPPPAGQRAAILVRALAPARPPKRRSVVWMVAALLVCNATIVTILAIVLARPASAPAPSPALPAGGGPTIAHLQELVAKLEIERRELVRKLEEQQRELQRRIAELETHRAIIAELSKKLGELEEREKLPSKRPAPKRPAPAPSPFETAGCDEVSCVLGNYHAPCCARFKQAAVEPEPSEDPYEVPRWLDRAVISKGIAKVKPFVQACGERSAVKGKVKVMVKVNASGHVASVTVVTTPDAALGTCVAAAIQRAWFEKTENGGSFTYPFVF